MKLIVAGVTFSAAIVRSPSFSRSASSTTITMRPARMSSTASSIRANGPFVAPAIFSACARFAFRCDFFPPPCVRFFISMRDFPRLRARERQAGELCGADDILPDHVALEVHAIANLHATEVGVRHRERHDLHVEAIGAEPGDRQADP